MDESELQRLIKMQQLQDGFTGISEEDKAARDAAQMQDAMSFKPSNPLGAQGSGPMSPEEMMQLKARAEAIRQARDDAMRQRDGVSEMAMKLAQPKRRD
jgi:hypothetical protein